MILPYFFVKITKGEIKMKVRQITRLIERKRKKLRLIYAAAFAMYSAHGIGEIVLLDENRRPIDNITYEELQAL